MWTLGLKEEQRLLVLSLIDYHILFPLEGFITCIDSFKYKNKQTNKKQICQ